MTVKRIDPAGWYEYETSESVLCGECVQDDLIKTATGVFTGDAAVTLDMVRELTTDFGKYQCDGCLEQSDNYDDDDE